MSDNVLAFPGDKTSDRAVRHTMHDEEGDRSSSGRPYRKRWEKNMHALLFRSRQSVLEADEEELLEDVRCDLDKAARKLEAARLHLENVQARAAAEVQELNAVIAKLGAAVVAAVLRR